MKWRILGPIEAETDTTLVPLDRPRHRALLAYLLLNANQLVSMGQLIEAFWGGAPPVTAPTQVHACVSHVRKALRSAGADRLLHQRTPGYRITVADGALDLTEFTSKVVQARSAVDSGQLDNAATLYRLGLSLWRGTTALMGASGAFVEAATAGLQERRLAAWEELADVELALGRHAALVQELHPLVSAHPLRERLVGQLMLALHRTGRQADALDVYRRHRHTLRDEYGLTPGRALIDLQMTVMMADDNTPPIELAHTNGAVPSLPVADDPPAQLPPDVPGFIGRGPEIAWLDALLATAEMKPTTAVISAVSGTAGVGKTALAVHWAHAVRGLFPDGQLYINLRSFDPHGDTVSPSEAVRGFLDAFDVPAKKIPAETSAQVGMYRSLLAGRRVLVVLDNARDADHVRQLLPGVPGCVVLVTSRNELTPLVASEGAVPMTLDLLTDYEAHEMLAHRLGRRRVEAEPGVVAEIVMLCARLPLALAVVAARAATHPGFPLAALADELRDSRDRLDALDGGDATTNVRAVFSWSYQTLGTEAARLFRLLGVHPGPHVTTSAAASLADEPLGQARRLLAQLTRAHLVTETAPDRYVLHDLLRAYAAELAHMCDTDGERRAATHRLLDHYLHTGRCAALLLSPHRDPITLTPPRAGVVSTCLTDHAHALSWFTVERPVLLAAIEQATRDGFDAHVWQLAWTLTEFFDRQGHWHHWISTQKTALVATRRSGDRVGQAVVHRALALALSRIGQYDDAKAHLARALDLFRDLGDHSRQAWTLLNLSVVFEQQGDFEQALRHARLALDLFRRPGSDTELSGQARALNTIGWDFALLGQHEQSLIYCRQALTILEGIGDRTNQAATWDSIGYAHHHLGRYQEAIVCYQRSIAMYQEFGSRYYQATVLTHLGDTHHAAGSPVAARDTWQQGLDIFEELGHPDADQVRAKIESSSAVE